MSHPDSSVKLTYFLALLGDAVTNKPAGRPLTEAIDRMTTLAKRELDAEDYAAFQLAVNKRLDGIVDRKRTVNPKRRNPSGPLTYHHFYLTGRQDCGNAFELRDFDLDAGTPEQIVAAGMADWDEHRQEWIDQMEPESYEGLDPIRAHAEWKRGWADCAIESVKQALEERAERALYADDEPVVNPPRRMRSQHIVTELVKARGKNVWPVNSPEDVVMALADYIGKRATEVFVVMFVNVRNQVVGYIEFTEGSLANVAVSPSEIYRVALSVAAPAFITAHNHPTGDATPSDDDRTLWSTLRNGAKAIGGLHLLDNFVLGEDEYFSESMDRTKRYPASVERIREVEA